MVSAVRSRLPPDVGALLGAARVGAGDAFFSLKTFLSAILAYYIALRIGLPRPYWAIVTCYIVAQPLAGAMLSKALFRMIGTLIGGCVAVFAVPLLVNAPELLTWALGLWLALCSYIAMLDRTPKSYIFLLAGYTAAIVGLPAVDHPGTVFDLASLRIQEIVIGISASSIVNALLLPRSVSATLADRIGRMVRDAERWSRDALIALDAGTLDQDRRRLALDLYDLHQLAVHLPFDLTRLAARIAVLRVIQHRLSLLLPLASGVEDRLGQLRAIDGVTPDLAELVSDVAAWLDGLHHQPATIMQADRLIDRAAALEPGCDDPWDWTMALRVTLLDRLQALIHAHRDIGELRAILTKRGGTVRPALRRAIGAARAQPLSRDHGLALRAAFATMGTMCIGTALWIGLSWPEGGSAVVIACILCALFSNLDEPGPTATRALFGTLTAIPISAFYAFTILPAIHDFPTLAIMLAPALLAIGSIQSRPGAAAYAIGIMLTLPGLMGLNESYDGNFATFANAAAAQVTGVMIALFMLNLASSLGTRSSVSRLVRAGWREVAAMAAGRAPINLELWIGQMLDRVAMLMPRLRALAIDPGPPMMNILTDTRIGVAIADLHAFQRDATPQVARQVAALLRRIDLHYSRLRGPEPTPAEPALVRAIDRLLLKVATIQAAAQRRRGVVALTSLRRNLSPAAPPPEILSR